MKNFIKLKLVNYLSNFFLRIEPKFYNNSNSLGIKIGSNSFFEKPKILDGAEYIEIKENSSIGHSSWLGAFNKYFNQSTNVSTTYPKNKETVNHQSKWGSCYVHIVNHINN